MADDYQVVAKGRWSDSLDETRNVFYAHAEGAGALLQLTDWVVDMWTEGTYPLINIITNKWSLYSVEVKSRDTTVWISVAETPTVLVGASSSDPLAHLLAGVVTGLTASRSRPKKYIAGLCEVSASSGVILPVDLPHLEAFGAKWVTEFTSGGVTVTPGYWANADAGPVLPMTGYRVAAVMGTQRRRKQGRGI